jgi:hypothetical protein
MLNSASCDGDQLHHPGHLAAGAMAFQSPLALAGMQTVDMLNMAQNPDLGSAACTSLT